MKKYSWKMLFEDFKKVYPNKWRKGTSYHPEGFMTLLIIIPEDGKYKYEYFGKKLTLIEKFLTKNQTKYLKIFEREERMIEHLRGLGLRVFSPKENCHLNAKASQDSREQVFKENCEAIKSSRCVFAVTDGKDMGTIWEAGYAYGIGKPVVYFAETVGDNQFNLMLAQSGCDVFTSQNEVTHFSISSALSGNGRKFRGDIE